MVSLIPLDFYPISVIEILNVSLLVGNDPR